MHVRRVIKHAVAYLQEQFICICTVTQVTWSYAQLFGVLSNKVVRKVGGFYKVRKVLSFFFQTVLGIGIIFNV